jgi:hypothetical protein
MYEGINKARSAQILSCYSNNEDVFEKGGKKALLGEVRVYNSGEKWKKTSTGWEQVHDVHTHKEDGGEAYVKKVTPEHIHYEHYNKYTKTKIQGKDTHEDFRKKFSPVTIHEVSPEGQSAGTEHVSNYHKEPVIHSGSESKSEYIYKPSGHKHQVGDNVKLHSWHDDDPDNGKSGVITKEEGSGASWPRVKFHDGGEREIPGDFLKKEKKEGDESDIDFKIKPGSFPSLKLLNQIAEIFPNRIFPVIHHNHAYAEGITGSSNYEYIDIGDGTGFANKSEARKKYSEDKKSGKYKSRETQKNRGYGRLGDFYSEPTFVTGKELKEIEKKRSGSGFYPTRSFIQ